MNHSDEEIYDENLLKSIKNVQTAAELCGSSAITALKITAFVPPEILQKLNQIIEQQRQLSLSPTKASIIEIASSTSIVNKVLFFIILISLKLFSLDK